LIGFRSPRGAAGTAGRVGRNLGRRVAQTIRIYRADGSRVLMSRALQAGARRLGTFGSRLEIREADVLAAAPAGAAGGWGEGSVLPGAPFTPRAPPLVVNWVMAPPSGGSGGHTTIFRLIEFLESRGHTCRVYLYDRYLGDMGVHAAKIRQFFPNVVAEIGDATAEMASCDAMFATSWPTAYVTRNSPAPGKRYYLVQDYEPFFYPVGSESGLAENTYRFGFHAITVGPWLAEKLSDEFGMTCDHVEFGCDTRRYRLKNHGSRSGVVFYARPSTPRRAFELGVLALQLFSTRHPEIKIHLFGEELHKLPFPFTSHGVLSPDDLNELYNQCAAGLTISMTNISLIPLELLAAGCIPVVNDAQHNRRVLDNPHVCYAPASPQGLAEALSCVVRQPDLPARARSASGSVQAASWAQAGETVERVLRRERGR
jgi:O-antigen biosynthesis protein